MKKNIILITSTSLMAIILMLFPNPQENFKAYITTFITFIIITIIIKKKVKE